MSLKFHGLMKLGPPYVCIAESMCDARRMKLWITTFLDDFNYAANRCFGEVSLNVQKAWCTFGIKGPREPSRLRRVFNG